MLTALAGWFGGVLWQGGQTQKAVVLFDAIRHQDFKERADDAYKRGKTEVAIWELEYLSSRMLRDHDRVINEKTERLELFLTFGRLARLYENMKMTNEAAIAFKRATNYYNVDYPKAQIATLPDLDRRIIEFDKITKIERHPVRIDKTP